MTTATPLRIGEVAERLGTTTRTIRYYEEIGLLGGGEREAGRHRIYEEADVERLMAWPHTNICTDGQLDGRHPRGFGTYPRVLGLYVRERKVMGLEEAVRKMTGLAAGHVGLRDRGVIRPGAFADLVLFDPATVIDRATTKEPQAVSVGMDKVWVNGLLVFEGGAATGARSGRVLKREPH